MKHLYEITHSYSNLISLLENIEDEEIDSESINKLLASISGELTDKATDIAAVIKNIEHLSAGIKDAEKRLKERRNAIDSKLESLKNYLVFNMQQCNINKITSPQFEISLKKKPTSVVIEKEDAIPAEFMRMKITTDPDKIAIKDVLSRGGVVEGAVLSDTAYTLSIK